MSNKQMDLAQALRREFSEPAPSPGNDEPMPPAEEQGASIAALLAEAFRAETPHKQDGLAEHLKNRLAAAGPRPGDLAHALTTALNTLTNDH